MTRDEMSFYKHIIKLAEEIGIEEEEFGLSVGYGDLGELYLIARKETCNELADKIDKMPFGDTAASFAVWIREQA